MLPPPGTGKRGRPKKCWLKVIRDDIHANYLTVRAAEDLENQGESLGIQPGETLG